MLKGFAVTYERWTHQDAEDGETDDTGFIVQDVSLTDAINRGLEFYNNSGHSFQPNDSRPEHVQWLDFYDWNNGTREYYENGIQENRALHIPDNVTASSVKRIIRLLSR